MKRAVLLVTLIAMAILALYWSVKTNRNHEDAASSDHNIQSVPPEVSADCPIRAVSVGMSFNAVKHALKKTKLEDRGTHQDQDVYFATARNCHAFLDFNSIDGKLDVIDYGLGFNKMLFRNNAPSALTTPSPLQVQESSPKKTSMGFPVPEDLFVKAYVEANLATDEWDAEHLTVLAHDEYQMGKMMDTQFLLLSHLALHDRAWKAMDLIDHIHKSQPSDSTLPVPTENTEK